MTQCINPNICNCRECREYRRALLLQVMSGKIESKVANPSTDRDDTETKSFIPCCQYGSVHIHIDLSKGGRIPL